MSRFSMGLVVAILAGMLPAVTQAQKTPAGQELVGTWTGLFKSDMGGGSATLVVSRKGLLEATFDIKPEPPAGGAAAGGHGTGGGHAMQMGEVTSLKVDGKTITWSQQIMGSDCKAEATREGSALDGQLDCGAYLLTFALRKS